MLSCSQRFPGVPGGVQGCAGVPRSSQRCPGVPRGAWKCPGVPRGARVFLGVPGGSQGFPGVPRGARVFSGVPRGARVFPGVPGGARGLPGVPGCSQGCPGVRGCSQGCAGSPRGARGFPGVPGPRVQQAPGPWGRDGESPGLAPDSVLGWSEAAHTEALGCRRRPAAGAPCGVSRAGARPLCGLQGVGIQSCPPQTPPLTCQKPVSTILPALPCPSRSFPYVLSGNVTQAGLLLCPSLPEPVKLFSKSFIQPGPPHRSPSWLPKLGCHSDHNN